MKKKIILTMLCFLFIQFTNTFAEPLPNEEEVLEQAENLFKQGDYNGGVDLLEQVVHFNPNNDSVLFTLSSLYVQVFKDIERAAFYAEKVSDTFEGKYFAHLFMAKNEHSKGNTKKAIFHYESVLKGDPEIEEALLALGSLYMQKDQLKKAKSYFQRLLKVTNDDQNALFGMALVEQLGENYYESIKYSEKLLEINSEMPDIFVILGNSYTATGQYTKGIKTFQKGLRLSADIAQSNLGLGQCYNGKKEYKKAISYLEKALNANPDEALRQYIIEELEKAEKA